MHCYDKYAVIEFVAADIAPFDIADILNRVSFDKVEIAVIIGNQ